MTGCTRGPRWDAMASVQISFWGTKRGTETASSSAVSGTPAKKEKSPRTAAAEWELFPKTVPMRPYRQAQIMPSAQFPNSGAARAGVSSF